MLNINKVYTFYARIYCGRKEGYKGRTCQYGYVQRICSSFAKKIKTCVSLKKIEFFYASGSERGVEIEFINYPRFPKDCEEIESNAIRLGKILKRLLKQNRVTILTPTSTIMIGNTDGND